MLRLHWLLIFALFLTQVAWADMGFVLWKPEGYSFTFAIPLKEGKSEQEAVEEYLGSLEKNPELKKFAQYFENHKPGKLEKFEEAKKVSVFAIANDPGDLAPTAKRLHGMMDPLEKRGAKIFVLPVAATASLDSSEKKEFQALLNKEADLLVAMGGDDIHPDLYGMPMRYSVNTNLSRDKEEVSLVKSYLQEGEGFFYGVCRGHQMACVASGCTLISDIQKELDMKYPTDVMRTIRINKDAGELTKKIFGGKKKIEGYNYHHQAVIVPEGAPLKVTASAELKHSIVQMAEYNGGRGISVQFHPELTPRSALHKRVYDTVYSRAREAMKRRWEKMAVKKTVMNDSCRMQFSLLK